MYKRPVPPKKPGVIPAQNPGARAASQTPSLDWQKWQLPIIEDIEKGIIDEEEPVVVELSPVDLEAIKAEQEARELEALREAAHTEAYALGLEAGKVEGREVGYNSGYEDGMAQAQKEAQEALAVKLSVLDAMIAQSRDEFSRLQEEVGESLVHLGVRVAEHVLGHAIKRPANSALAIVKEVLRQNDEDDQVLTIWLHPQDLNLIEDDIKAIPVLCKLRILPDEGLERGGAKVRTPHGDVDATLQTRWHAAVASIGYAPSSRKGQDE